MASLFEGFEYDIFISYRQKDNKGNRWVSEFVEALKVELESTFKEEISIYFDENPHDGLLETHDVNASLKEKLKCLIFIPVISRTYCDPKCFAWEHEFIAFIEQASHDRFGLKIRLPSGNVSTRVLPIRIHDLDADDTKLCESALGGVIRSIDFIYKAPGVNRPLLSNEDHPRDNMNKTYYRDQINKVANAIDDIVHSLKNSVSDNEEGVKNRKKSRKEDENEEDRALKEKFFGSPLKRRITYLAFFIILILAGFLTYRSFFTKNHQTTIAVLPFDFSGEKTGEGSYADAFTNELITKLFEIKEFTTQPYLNVLRYKVVKKTVRLMGRELNSDYLINGFLKKNHDTLIISITINDVRKDKQLWNNSFTNVGDVWVGVQTEISKAIANALKTDITNKELSRIRRKPTTNTDAYKNYIRGNLLSSNAELFVVTGNKYVDSTSYLSAIEMYDKAIKLDSMFALAYANRAITISWAFYNRQVDSSYIERCKADIDKALSIDKGLIDAQNALGFYYYYCKSDYAKALEHFGNSASVDPGNYRPLFYMALVYRKLGDWQKSQSLLQKVIKLNPQEALFLTNIGLSYSYLHKYDSAIIFHQKAIEALPGWTSPYINKIENLILLKGYSKESGRELDTAIQNTGKSFLDMAIRLDMYQGKYNDALLKAEKSGEDDFSSVEDKYLRCGMLTRLLYMPAESKRYYDSAIVILNKKVETNKRDTWSTSMLGIALAGKGLSAQAIEKGVLAIDIVSKDDMERSDLKVNLAMIYTMVGKYNMAVKSIKELLEAPACLSPKLLVTDPVWKPLLQLSDMKEIIANYSKDHL